MVKLIEKAKNRFDYEQSALGEPEQDVKEYNIERNINDWFNVVKNTNKYTNGPFASIGLFYDDIRSLLEILPSVAIFMTNKTAIINGKTINSITKKFDNYIDLKDYFKNKSIILYRIYYKINDNRNKEIYVSYVEIEK